MGFMEIIDATGHTKHVWDSDNQEEVDAAEAVYDSLTEKGYRAFRVKKDGDEGERMTEFDPNAESMIMMPALKGG